MPATRRAFTETLVDSSTGAVLGLVGTDNREYLVPVALQTTPASTLSISGVPISGSTGSFTTVAASSTVTFNGANAAVSLAPTGTGNVTVGAAGTGSTTVTRVGSLTVLSTDSSGTPGNATINTLSGRAAFAAAGTTVVVTNSTVAATSKVFVSLRAGDSTLTSVRVTPAAGSFTVTGNAAATATTIFDFFVVN
jgi:hypothetical protein